MGAARRLLALAVLASMGICPEGHCATDSGWTCVQSPHFTVLTPVSGDYAHDWALRMEQLYRGMNAAFHARGPQPPRVTVVLFANDDDFSSYKPLENGRPAAMAGFFMRGDGLNLIALSLDNYNAEFQRMIQHETVHWYFSTGGRPLPPWLEEGVAEVYSTFRMTDENTCRFGEPIPAHLSLLAHAELMPLQTLINLPHSAIHYDEARRTGIFYAQSWALVHYLIFSDEIRKTGRANALNRYVGALYAGPVSENTFISLFGFDYAQGKERLDDYIRDGAYHMYQFTMAGADVERTLRAYPARSGDCDLALGSLLLGNRGPAAAEPDLRRAAAELPRDPRPSALLGEAALRRGDLAAAADFYRQAIAFGTRESFVYFDLAQIRMVQLAGGQTVFDSGDGKDLAEPAALYRLAIRLKPAYLPTYQNLAGLILSRAKIQPGDAALMRYGNEIFPNEEIIQVALGAIALKTGHELEGRRQLQAILDRPKPGSSAAIREMAYRILQGAAKNAAPSN